jgi:hypothetical protein
VRLVLKVVRQNDGDLLDVILLLRRLIISISYAIIIKYQQDCRSPIDTHIHRHKNKGERREKRVRKGTVI